MLPEQAQRVQRDALSARRLAAALVSAPGVTMGRVCTWLGKATGNPALSLAISLLHVRLAPCCKSWAPC